MLTAHSNASQAPWYAYLLEGLILLPLWYCLTVMWWMPEGVKYVPGMIGVALLAFLVPVQKR